MTQLLNQEQVDELFETWMREDDARIIRTLQRRLAWVATAPVQNLPEQLKRQSYGLGSSGTSAVLKGSTHGQQ